MKLGKVTIIQIIGCIIGFSLLLYPTVSNYWNSKHATQAINNYLDTLYEITDSQYEKILNEAYEYNIELLNRDNYYILDNKLKKKYDSLLNINKDGIMAYIDIEKIEVTLPIYHTVDDDVLQSGIGHLEWSSLPIGGIGVHSVVSGHRGLPNMKLFTNLDKLDVGDTFTINVLKETLFYEVDQVKIVDPDDVSDLMIDKDSDYVTLVTCTPYGINTHRLLVRGHRVENKYGNIKIVSEAVIVDYVIVATLLTIPFLLVLILIVIFKKPKEKFVYSRRRNNEENN